jgi:hemolysin activation/secretion protein
VLDYIVRQEPKPFYIYTQASNTGTEETGDWRLRTGFEYRNLIGHDDILNGDYIFSPDGKSQSVLGSYSRALLPPDKLKLRIYANWGTFTASDVGFDLQNFDGESWTVGAALTICPFKIKGVPINLFLGTEWRNVSVVNHTFPQTGDTDFFVPYVGFSFQQTTDRYSFAGFAQFEHNFPDIAGTSQAEMDKLGRFGTTPDFTVAKWSGAISTYLEPIIFGPKWKEGSTWWKSTLAHEIAFTAHGQYAFDHARLIPQFEDVIGGFTSVRGYPESLTAGDTTVVGSLEYRIHLPRLLKPADKVAQDKAKAASPTDTTAADIPPQKFALRPTAVGSAFGRPDWDFIIRGFLDGGLTYNDHRVPSAEANEELAGTGVGVELQISRYVDIRADWGIALLPEEDFLVHPVHRGDSRFNFLLSLLW